MGFQKPTLEGVPKESEVLRNISKINSIVSQQLGIGIAGQDPTENITTLDRQFHGQEARHIYRSLDIVQRIIDTPAKDALKEWFKIETNYPEFELGKRIDERLQSLDAKNQILQFLIYSRLYSRGTILFPVIREWDMLPDRSHLRSRLFHQNIEAIEDLNIIHEEFFYYNIQSYDPFAIGFGRPEFVNVHGVNLDFSRFFLHINSLDIYRQRGISILDRVVVACKGINVAEWTIQNLLLRYRSLLVKFPANEINSKDQQRQSMVQELIQTIKLKFTSKSVAAIPDNYEFEYLQTSLTGLKEATDFLYAFLASVTRVPQSILKGSAQGELASAEKDQRDYYDLVKSEEQEAKVKPLLDFLIPMILYEKQGEIYPMLLSNGIDPAAVTFKVEFNSLQSVNPLQDAQTKLIDSQRAEVDQRSGVRDSMEIREELYPNLDRQIPNTGMDPFAGMYQDPMFQNFLNGQQFDSGQMQTPNGMSMANLFGFNMLPMGTVQGNAQQRWNN